MTAIVAQINAVSPAIAYISSQIATIVTDVNGVGANISTIASQFLPGSTFSRVFTKIAKVRTPISNVAV